MTFPLYVSVIEHKLANRALKLQYLKVKEELFRYWQLGSSILVNSGMAAVLGNGAPAVCDL